LAALLLGALAAPAPATEWPVSTGSVVEFTASITGGSFVARSEKVSGRVAAAGPGGAVPELVVVVDAASFETGIDLRDEHLRAKYLEADKFPELRFQAPAPPLTAKVGSEVTLNGTLNVKGVSRPLQARAKVEASSPGELVATARFKVDITQFGIPRPGFAVVRMDPVVEVSVRIVLKRSP